ASLPAGTGARAQIVRQPSSYRSASVPRPLTNVDRGVVCGGLGHDPLSGQVQSMAKFPHTYAFAELLGKYTRPNTIPTNTTSRTPALITDLLIVSHFYSSEDPKRFHDTHPQAHHPVGSISNAFGNRGSIRSVTSTLSITAHASGLTTGSMANDAASTLTTCAASLLGGRVLQVSSGKVSTIATAQCVGSHSGLNLSLAGSFLSSSTRSDRSPRNHRAVLRVWSLPGGLVSDPD